MQIILFSLSSRKSLTAFVCANSMAVCANYVTFGYFIKKAPNTHLLSHFRDGKAFFICIAVIKVHHVKRKFAAAIGARLRFMLAHNFPKIFLLSPVLFRITFAVVFIPAAVSGTIFFNIFVSHKF